MSERAYTVSEIDALRSALQDREIWGSSLGPEGSGSTSFRSYNAAEMERRVEDKIRTYMVAGITAKDIYDEDQRRRDEMKAAFKALAFKEDATPPSARSAEPGTR